MWKYGKLKEFPTFPHNKQTTIVYSLYLEKCKPITGLKLKCKLITGLIIKSVNFFQDDTNSGTKNADKINSILSALKITFSYL
ncbi:hypothetical protein ACVW2L_004268 [Mucilaginibacter sp. HD30]